MHNHQHHHHHQQICSSTSTSTTATAVHYAAPHSNMTVQHTQHQHHSYYTSPSLNSPYPIVHHHHHSIPFSPLSSPILTNVPNLPQTPSPDQLLHKTRFDTTLASVHSAASRMRIARANVVSAQPRTIFLLDWDDTCCATTYLEWYGIMADLDTRLDECAPALHRALRVLEQRVLSMLKACVRLGQLLIVTNAGDGWVELSSSRFLPAVWAFLDKHYAKVKIISARARYIDLYRHMPWRWKALTFCDVLSEAVLQMRREDERAERERGGGVWKKTIGVPTSQFCSSNYSNSSDCMDDEEDIENNCDQVTAVQPNNNNNINNVNNNNINNSHHHHHQHNTTTSTCPSLPSSTPRDDRLHVVVLGDSPGDRYAAHDSADSLAKMGLPVVMKIVKFLERPTIDQLCKQLGVLLDHLTVMTRYHGCFEVSMSNEQQNQQQEQQQQEKRGNKNANEQQDMRDQEQHERSLEVQKQRMQQQAAATAAAAAAAAAAGVQQQQTQMDNVTVAAQAQQQLVSTSVAAAV